MSDNAESNAELPVVDTFFAMVFETPVDHDDNNDINTVPERTNENDKGVESGDDDSTGIPRIQFIN